MLSNSSIACACESCFDTMGFTHWQRLKARWTTSQAGTKVASTSQRPFGSDAHSWQEQFQLFHHSSRVSVKAEILLAWKMWGSESRFHLKGHCISRRFRSYILCSWLRLTWPQVDQERFSNHFGTLFAHQKSEVVWFCLSYSMKWDHRKQGDFEPDPKTQPCSPLTPGASAWASDTFGCAAHWNGGEFQHMGSVQNPGWLVILADNTTQYTGDILGIIILIDIYYNNPRTGNPYSPTCNDRDFEHRPWGNPPVLQGPKKIKRQHFMRCFHMWEIHGNSRFVALKYVFF